LSQSQVAESKIVYVYVYVYVHEHEHEHGRATELKPGSEGQVLAVIIKGKTDFILIITGYYGIS
jgi:uncharacterized cupredoxin-like copper-binding protein